MVVRAEAESESSTGSPDLDKLVKDLAEKWDKVENKSSVIVYTVSAFVLIWFSSTIVNAVNAVPVVRSAAVAFVCLSGVHSHAISFPYITLCISAADVS